MQQIQDTPETYIRRWYDDDPELRRIVDKLKYSNDEIRSKVALLIIKIIINRKILNLEYENIEDILDSIYAGYADTRRARWYDIDSTVRTAMQMLHDMPYETRASVALEIKNSHKYICIFPI